jgi:uncharacterized protein (TIGR02145 family)
MHKRLSLRLIGFLVLVLLFIGCIFQCSSFAFGQNKIIYGILTDNRDHQSYKTVSIGNQVWMAENLNFKTPYSFCYDDSTSNCTKYGRLYKLYEAVAACPDGWRLPTLEDWNTLLYSVGGESVAGKKLKSSKGWLGEGNGTDNYGFSVLPAGFRYREDSYSNEGFFTVFYAYNNSSSYVYGVNLSYYSDHAELKPEDSDTFFSVRCIKGLRSRPKAKSRLLQANNEIKFVEVRRGSRMEGDYLVDLRDNQFYKTVVIGSQTWMAENLNYYFAAKPCENSECFKNGHSYEWKEAKKACPDGWHLPTIDEWKTLISYAGEKEAGKKLRYLEREPTVIKFGKWEVYYDPRPTFFYNENRVRGTDDFGFGASGSEGYWGATEDGDSYAYCVYMPYSRSDTEIEHEKKSKSGVVRCLKDSSEIASKNESTPDLNYSREKNSFYNVSLTGQNGDFVDSRDCQIYKTVTIGTQIWMAQNLNYKKAKSHCLDIDRDENRSQYELYLWRDAMDACPSGWRLPSDADWNTLIDAVGGSSFAGKVLKSSTGWFGYGNGTDEYGFSAIPNDIFGRPKKGHNAVFWSATEDLEDYALAMYLLYYTDNAKLASLSKNSNYLVRCIKGDSPKIDKRKMVEAEPITDERDGHIYKTVKIGTQTWMAENLNFTTENSFCYNDSLSYCAKYGRFYSWGAAMDSAGVFSSNGERCESGKNCIPIYPVRGVCPMGWHLPSMAEWLVLISSAGGLDSAGKALKTLEGWNGNDIGTDDYGFSAIPAGYVSGLGDWFKEFERLGFNNNGYTAAYWSSTENDFEEAYAGLVLSSHDKSVSQKTKRKADIGLNVRCVKDEEESPEPSSYVALARQRQAVESMTDPRDGQIYRTVTIGEQTWMAQNLNYESEYSACDKGYFSNCAKYGRLYTWTAATDSAGICPVGWHLPTEMEWVTLFNAVGGRDSVDNALRSTSGWRYGDKALDKYGFSALPAGKMKTFSYNRNEEAFFWSSTAFDNSDALAFCLHSEKGKNHFVLEHKNAGLSIRCLKDFVTPDSVSSSVIPHRVAGSGSFMTDSRDGQTYRTVKIGSQTWMAENLNYKADSSKCYMGIDSNCTRYGRLYQWQDLKAACPSGWHLPTQSEWDTLLVFVGGKSVAGKKLKSTSNWEYCHSKIDWYSKENGTDDYGFSVLPFGVRCFHTAENDENSMEVEICFSNCSDSVEWTDRYTDLDDALSVRCVKNDSIQTKPLSGASNRDGKREKSAHVVPPSRTIKRVFTDSRDGRKYKTVTIGKQTWMAENLNYKTKKSLCLYNDPADCSKHGRFYTWKDAMKVCPAGWHLPSDADWNTLIDAVGDSVTAARVLKSKDEWCTYKDINGGGTDDYGFSALPVGKWIDNPDLLEFFKFNGECAFAGFWSSKEQSSDSAKAITMEYFFRNVFTSNENKTDGYNVRCIKN